MALIIFQGATQEIETETEDPGGTGLQPSFPPANGREFAEGQIIVKLEEQATQADLAALNQRNDARIEENLPRSDLNVVDLPDELTVGEAVRRYEASPDVEYAEPDYVLQPMQTSPNDPSYPKLYGLNNTGQTNGSPDADVDAKEAWGTTTGVPGTVVAVIDEGVDVNHPDIRSNIWVNTDEVPDNGIDDDRNGYVDDVNGWDFAHDDSTVYDAADGDDHGTHVAGTIAAQGNNGTGITGVNWRGSIMVCKFMGSNGGYTSDAVEALNYAVANGAMISNNSWGGGGSSLSLQSAITRADSAGHLFVAAAGNSGSNNDTTPSYPASYNNPNIISVAATDHRDALASFSNFGATTVDLAAPGVNILSTLPGNRYGSYSGTSMATPHVTGVAALIKSSWPALEDAQMRSRILQSVDKKANLQGTSATGGRLNASGALSTEKSELRLVANPLTVNYGGGTFLSGTLTSSGEPLSGREVILEQRPVGASDFSQVPDGVRTTDTNGNFSLAGVIPDTNTDYRARFAGEGSTGVPPATSLNQRVNVEGEPELRLVANPLTVNYGGGTFLSGTLTSSGEPLSGREVILEQRPVGASDFSQVPDGVRTTDTNGNFSLAGVIPDTNTDYRARFAGEEGSTGLLGGGSAGIPPLTSTARRTNVKVLISLSTTTAKLKLGGREIISGSVSPAHTGSVRLIIERNGMRLTTQTVTLTSTGYRFAYKPTRTGTYTVHASFGSDTDHLSSTSVARTFKVVR